MRNRLQTDRLILRPLFISDAPLFSKYAGDYDIARMTGSIAHPFPLLSAEFKIMSMREARVRNLAYPYAITLDGEDMIGVMDLFRRHPNSDLEIGYWVARPFWGQGYACEAARAIIDEARNTLGVTHFVAGVFDDNPGSQKVLERLGFKRDATPAQMYFSMARLKKARSLSYTLNTPKVARQQAVPLRQKSVILEGH